MGRLRQRLRGFATLRMFAEDRPLLYATLLMASSALLPLAMTPILPLVDLGSNIGAAALLDDAAFRGGVAAHYYEVNFAFTPYWTGYLTLALLEQVVGALLAAKVAVGAVVVLLPVAGMRLLRALGRSPRLGLWLFLLTWDNNLYWGWITFQLGMVLALFTLARVIELRNARDASKVFVLTFLIALTHLHAVALTLTAGGLLALQRRPYKRYFPLHVLALGGCAVPLLAWLFAKLGNQTTAGIAQAFTFEMPALRDRLTKLFAYTIDNLPEEGSLATACAFGLLLFGPVLMSMLRQRELPARLRWAPLLLVLACGGLYACLPMAIHGPVYHWYTYPRFGTYLLAALLFVPRPVLQGFASLALVPGLLIAVEVHRGIAQQFEMYGAYVRPYVQIIDGIARNSRILPLDLDDYAFKGTREAVLGQLHGYAAAATSSYDPHLFDEPNNPLRFRRGLMPPYPSWRRPRDFSIEEHGVYYDYIIVHPAKDDPIQRRRRWSKHLDLVREAGHFRLYKVKARKPFPKP